jgi:outer membrane protein assembly factor BamB
MRNQNSLRRLLTACLALSVTGLSVAGTAAQAQWPGLLGPKRDGYASEGAQLRLSSSKSSPKLRWEIDAGQGYAGAAISDGRAVLYQRDASQDVLRYVSMEDGKVQWQREFPATYRQGVDSDTGPRCVPVMTDDCIVIYSAGGLLACVERKDGTVRWSRELRKEFGAEDGYFGAGSTPLIVGASIIVNVGGRKKGGVVSVSILDGKTQWSATDADASYASPILWAGKGEQSETVVVPTRLTTYGLEPKTGRVLWQLPFGQRGPTVNAATPVVTEDGNLFLTSSYGIGFLLVGPKATGAKVSSDVDVIAKGDSISSQYATPIAVSNMLFGTDGREDGGWPSFRCVDAKTGETIWSEAGMPICHVIGVKGSQDSTDLLLVGINGKMWVLPATKQGFAPTWTSQLPEGKYRALPALSKNLLVVRSSGGSNAKWYCFEL